MSRDWIERAEQNRPWVIYRYGLTHDKWWPFWNSTRVLGYCRIICECMVCGDRTIVKMSIPRFGAIPHRGYATERIAYLRAHEHPDKGAPMSWAKPLMNMNAHTKGLDLDALAMRLEADINAGQEGAS